METSYKNMSFSELIRLVKTLGDDSPEAQKAAIAVVHKLSAVLDKEQLKTALQNLEELSLLLNN